MVLIYDLVSNYAVIPVTYITLIFLTRELRL